MHRYIGAIALGKAQKGQGAMHVANLPGPVSSFVGREQEVRDVRELIRRGSRLLTLVGIGGIGKTRLAIEVAREPQELGVAECSLVSLAALTDPSLVLPAIAEAIGARDDERGPLAAITARAGASRMLLLLDNMERLRQAIHDITTLIQSCPALQLLVTSRVPLGLEGECIVEIGPLPLPGCPDGTNRSSMHSNPAVRLFLDRAHEAVPGFEADDSEIRVIADICQRLDGIPLAIELAAARVTVLPPSVLRQRLAQRLPLLSRHDPRVPERLQTMRNAIAWSYELLPPTVQALFRRLSVFEGGFSLTAAEQIAAGWSPADGYPFAGRQRMHGQDWAKEQGKEPPQAHDGAWNPPTLPRLDLDVVDALAVLVNHRLIRTQKPVAGDAWFDMLETIREFGREELERTGEAFAVDHAHAAQTLARIEVAGWGLWGRERPVWMERLEADLGNYRAAMRWLASQPAPANQLCLRLADAPWHFWITRGRIAEGRRYLEEALARPGGTEIARAAAANTAGYLALIQHEPERARAMLEENLTRCLTHRYRIGEARCRFFLALVWWRLGDVLLMERHVSKALDLFAAESDRIGIGVSLIALAMIARQQGDLPRAETLLEEAKQRCEEAGFGWGEATCAYYQGETARARGDYRLAAGKLREALRRYHEQGDPVGMSGCLSGLAVLAAVRNDLQRAAVLFAAAGKLAEGATGFFPPTETTVYQDAVAAVRHRLGDHAYYQAASTGYAMPIEHVLNEAMQVDGRLHRPQPETPPSPPSASLDLTHTQQEVLALFVQGLDIADIAEFRHRSLSASYAMLARIKERLGVTKDTELIALALKHGFKGPEAHVACGNASTGSRGHRRRSHAR